MDIIPVFLDIFLRFFEHDKKHGFLIVCEVALILKAVERGCALDYEIEHKFQ